MALTIIWSKRAASGYAHILHYLELHWTQKEIRKFEKEVQGFFEYLKHFPNLLRKSEKTGIRQGPINRLTILTYRVDLQKKQIQIINIRSARQKPIKLQ